MKQKRKGKNMKNTLSVIAVIVVVAMALTCILFAFVGPIAIIYGNEQKVIFGAVACSIAVVVASVIWGYLSTGLSSKKAKVISIGLLLLATTCFAASLISGFNCNSQRYLTWAAALTSYITVIHPIIFGKMALN